MGPYYLTEDVALTILLHASKHPSSTVNGVLLGKPRGAGGFLISAAVPLFHRSHVLAPCVETGLAQVGRPGQQTAVPLLQFRVTAEARKLAVNTGSMHRGTAACPIEPLTAASCLKHTDTCIHA